MSKRDLHKLNTPAKILKYLGCAKFYRDGEAYSAVFNLWHPVTLILYIMYIPVCAFLSDRVQDILPVKLRPYYQEKKYKDTLEWL